MTTEFNLYLFFTLSLARRAPAADEARARALCQCSIFVLSLSIFRPALQNMFLLGTSCVFQNYLDNFSAPSRFFRFVFQVKTTLFRPVAFFSKFYTKEKKLAILYF